MIELELESDLIEFELESEFVTSIVKNYISPVKLMKQATWDLCQIDTHQGRPASFTSFSSSSRPDPTDHGAHSP